MLLWSQRAVGSVTPFVDGGKIRYDRSPSIVVDCVTFCEGVDELETKTMSW
jgi:hypothetical protein